MGELIPSLSANLASKSTPVRDCANECFVAIVSFVDPTLTAQVFSSTMQSGNLRVKEGLVDHVAALVPPLYASNPRLVTKYIIPLAFDLLKESKGGLRQGCVHLCSSLYDVMGESLLDAAAQLGEPQKKSLQQILASVV